MIEPSSSSNYNTAFVDTTKYPTPTYTFDEILGGRAGKAEFVHETHFPQLQIIA
jgi:hypothetical protein